MSTHTTRTRLTGGQLPRITVQRSEAGKRRRLSDEVEIIDLADDISDGESKMVNVKICEACYRLLTLIFKKGVLFANLVPNPSKRRTGRKAKLETEHLSIACVHSRTNKPYWRCIASGCKHFQAGNCQLQRVLAHAMDCSFISSELRDFAHEAAIELNAPGVRVNPKQIQTDTETQGAPPHKKVKTIQGTLTDVATTTGKAKYQDKVNLAIIELFAVSGVPPSVLDSLQWKKFVEVATNSKCNPPSLMMLTQKLIPAEAALVRKYQADFLRTCVNLTLTFDGGSTRKPSSVYTVHITTAERETLFMEGYEATTERHTAEYIEGLVTKVCGKPKPDARQLDTPMNPQVIDSIGPKRFTAICSDNTGNTKKARKNVTEKFPAIMNLADICHHLANTAKDISRLPEFEKV